MKLFSLFRAAALAATIAALPALAVDITGAGATFPYPIYSKWFDEYHKKNGSIEINYQSIGSGGGIRQLTIGGHPVYTFAHDTAAGTVAGQGLKLGAGTWYVIAHVPYFTERGQVSARNEYTLLGDDRIAVRYVYRNGFHAPVKSLEATATVVPGSGNREWRMRFFRVVRAKQRVLEVAPDTAWMLVAAPDRELVEPDRKPRLQDLGIGQAAVGHVRLHRAGAVMVGARAGSARDRPSRAYREPARR